ncbi:MAG TPA: hypothetical protein VLC12_04145 [Terriglobales bacterium]|nr:hypothetical protein [Terriglobales bacterium]
MKRGKWILGMAVLASILCTGAFAENPAWKNGPDRDAAYAQRSKRERAQVWNDGYGKDGEGYRSRNEGDRSRYRDDDARARDRHDGDRQWRGDDHRDRESRRGQERGRDRD